MHYMQSHLGFTTGGIFEKSQHCSPVRLNKFFCVPCRQGDPVSFITLHTEMLACIAWPTFHHVSTIQRHNPSSDTQSGQ